MTSIYFLIYVLFLIIVSFIYERIWDRRYPFANDIDKAIIRFKVSTIVFTAAMFAVLFWTSPTLFLDEISPQATPAESISVLVKNQEELRVAANNSREALYFGLFLIMLYFSSVITFIGKLQKHRQRDLEETNANVRNPLGLSDEQ